MINKRKDTGKQQKHMWFSLNIDYWTIPEMDFLKFCFTIRQASQLRGDEANSAGAPQGETR